MVNVVYEPIDDEQAETHTRRFLWFWLRDAVPIHPIFEPRPLNANVARWWNGHSSRVHWRGSLWINMFKRSSSNPEGLAERGVSLLSKRSFLKRENHFLVMVSPMALSPYTAQMFVVIAAFAPLLNSKRRICWKCSFSPLGTPFSSVHGSLTTFKWQNFNM